MTHKNIEFLRVNYLRGPNIWTYRPVVEAWVDIGDLEDFPSNTLPGFYDRLSTWLPGLIEHRCGVGERGGFLQRLREGTWPAHIMEHVAIELQNMAGLQAGFGKARSTSRRGVYKVAIRARNEEVARAALTGARDLVMAAINDQPFDVKQLVDGLREMVDDYHLGPSTACIVDAAAKRRIPAIRLTDGNLVQLGYSARQRRIWTAETDRTSAIAESISSDKDLTKSLLKSCGVPVPEGEVVDSPEAAWEAAQDIGLPVVVKPTDGNHGRGVSIELYTQADIEAAYHLAEREGSEVLVERFIPGDEHRLLVVGNRVVACAKGETAWVTGDGRSTVSELIDLQINTDPRRGTTEDFPLNVIRLEDDEAVVLELQRQGLTGDAVPDAGRRVLIQRNGNVANDVTAQVHPEVAEMVALAARVVGLDIAGIDVVASDIGKPLGPQRGAIVEVNAGPGLLMHLKPAAGEAQPVGEAIVDHLFPVHESGRVPVVGITGSRHTALISRLVAWLCSLSGRYVGLACETGLYFDQRQVEKTNSTSWVAGQRLLMNRSVNTAVFQHDARGILEEGLAYDRCQVGVVTDMGDLASLADHDILDADQLYTVIRTQVDVVLADGVSVLNADIERVAELAELSDGEVVFYAQSAETPVIKSHLADAGRAVYLRGDDLVLASGSHETVLPCVDLFRQVQGFSREDQEQVLLATAATVWALGVNPEFIRVGVERFDIGIL